jgi:ankyrin repeat protein
MGNASSSAGFELARAAEDGRPLQELLAGGADVSETDQWGWTALHYAAQGNRPESVRALLAAPLTDVNAMSPWALLTTPYLTPLMVAARERSSEALEAILSSPNVEVNARHDDRYCALHWAADSAKKGENSAIVVARELV